MYGTIKGAQSIAKAALLLRTLSTFASPGATLAEISSLADMPKSSAHRILAALVAEQLVERVSGSQNYRLGTDILAFGIALRETFDLKPAARPVLEALATDLGIASYLGVRSGYDMLCLDRCESTEQNHPLIMNVNDRWPLGVGSMGLSVLAFLPEAEMSKVIQFNQRRVDPLDALTFTNIRRSVSKTRLRGFAKRSMHSAERLTGIAVPVFNRRNYPVASVCAVLPSGQLDIKRLVVVVSRLREAGAQLSRVYEDGHLRPYTAETWRHAIQNSQSPRPPDLIDSLESEPA